MIEVKLNEILESRGISISEMSRDTGIARSTLTPIVNTPDEVKSIRFNTLDKICEYLNIDLTEVIDYIPNKEEFVIRKIVELEETNEGISVVSAIKENSFNAIPVFLSINGNEEFRLSNEDFEKTGNFVLSIEVMNGDEIIDVIKTVDSFQNVNETKENLDMYASEIRKWLLDIDRTKFRNITVSLISMIVDKKIYDITENVIINWNIGSMHFHPTKTNFEFELDFEKRLLNDVSPYNELNPEFNTNHHFN